MSPDEYWGIWRRLVHPVTPPITREDRRRGYTPQEYEDMLCSSARYEPRKVATWAEFEASLRPGENAKILRRGLDKEGDDPLPS